MRSDVTPSRVYVEVDTETANGLIVTTVDVPPPSGPSSGGLYDLWTLEALSWSGETNIAADVSGQKLTTAFFGTVLASVPAPDYRDIVMCSEVSFTEDALFAGNLVVRSMYCG